MIMPANDRAILVVEDCDEDFDTDWEGFRRTGRTGKLVRALTGDACLAMLNGSDTAEPLRPSMVLLDLNTPGRDGRAALKEIKANPELCEIPVVVLTTSSNPRDLKACYEHGANAYHVKPVRFPDHLGLLQQIFNYWLDCAVLPSAANSASTHNE